MTHPTTEARLRRIAAERAHNRRTRGVTDGGPHLRSDRLLAVFPGFPPLSPKYRADLAEAGTDTLRTEAWRASVRDLITRSYAR